MFGGGVCYWCNKKENIRGCEVDKTLFDIGSHFGCDDSAPTTLDCYGSAVRANIVKTDFSV